jgi:hypothetical protein
MSGPPANHASLNDTRTLAHLAGQVAAALMAHASELLAEPPDIQQIDVLAARLP